MKRNVLIMATAATLAGCNAFEARQPVRLTPTSGERYYCASERLTDLDGELVCDWHSRRADACQHEHEFAHLAKSAVVSGPDTIGRCRNGDHVVSVTIK